ncbi:MAG: hypothetical protein FJ011_22930 [Chloroflexi bacterium]|nr:hypothetical protein [Chloroflexota bacterium]
MLKLKDEEVLYMLETQIPELLERRPELEPRAFRAFLRVFTTKEETAAILAELREFHGEFLHFRTEVNERFEQVDQRFEQVDQRFEQVDQRLDGIDRRLDGVEGELGSIRNEMRDRFDLLQSFLGRFQTRTGRSLEDVVAGALRAALRRPDIKPEQLRLRQRLVDEHGLVSRGRQRRFEVDVLAEDGQLTVFEVKSYCNADDVDALLDRVVLVRGLNPGRVVEGVMIALSIEADVPQRCTELGLTLVHRGEVIPA